MILDYWAFQEQRVLETNNLHHELTSIRFFPILQSILFHSAALHKMISYKTCINVQSLVIGGTLDENHSAEVPDVEAQLLAEVTAWILKQYLSVGNIWRSEVKTYFGKLTGSWLLIGWQATHTVWSLRLNVGALKVWLLLTFDTPIIIFCWKVQISINFLQIFVSCRSNVLETMESDALLFIDEKTKLKEPWWDFADT